jgi:hypothetical protein
MSSEEKMIKCKDCLKELTNKYSELLLTKITEIKNNRYTLVKRKKQSKKKNKILSCDESLYHFQTRTTIVIKMEKNQYSWRLFI